MAEVSPDNPAPAQTDTTSVEGPEKISPSYFLDKLQSEPDAAPQPEETPAEVAQDDIATDLAATESEADPSEPEPVKDSEDSEAGEEEHGIEIRGERYTIDELEEVIADAESSRMTVDDYRRRTAYMNRIDDENKALSEDFELSSSVISEIFNANTKQFDSLDWSRLKAEAPEKYFEVLAQRDAAVKGQEIIKERLQERRTKIAEREDSRRRLEAQRSIELLKLDVPARFGRPWSDDLYKEAGSYAVQALHMPEETFNKITDPSHIQGLLALKVLDGMSKATGKKQTKAKRTRRQSANMQVQNPPRDGKGRYASAEKKALESRNAKSDGSFLDFKRAQLAEER